MNACGVRAASQWAGCAAVSVFMGTSAKIANAKVHCQCAYEALRHRLPSHFLHIQEGQPESLHRLKSRNVCLFVHVSVLVWLPYKAAVCICVCGWRLCNFFFDNKRCTQRMPNPPPSLDLPSQVQDFSSSQALVRGIVGVGRKKDTLCKRAQRDKSRETLTQPLWL